MAKKQQATIATLTDTRVKDAKAGTSVIRIWDTDTTAKGFHLRITPAGAKSFAMALQVKGETRKVNITIGDATAWTVDEARARAAELRKIHRDTGDVGKWLEEEEARKAELAAAEAQAAKEKEHESTRTLNAWAEVWRKKYKERLKPTTQASYESLLKHQVLPLLGERLVKDIDVKDVRRLHKTVVEEGYETSATRAVAVLYSLLKAAEENEEDGWRTDDSKTWKGFKMPGGNERKRTLTPRECAALEAALVALVAAERPKVVEKLFEKKKTRKKEVNQPEPEQVIPLEPQAADLIRFLALSGLRKGEALGLRFADVDLEQSTMSFKDHKTSGDTGVKVLPLNSHLRAIIQRRAQQQKIGDFVFPGRLRSKSPIVGLAHMWTRVVKAAQLVDVTLHDLRRTFYSTVTKLTMSFDVADILTGHSLPKVRRVYGIDPHESPIVIQASQDASDWIAAAMAGHEVKPGVKVVKKAKAGTA